MTDKDREREDQEQMEWLQEYQQKRWQKKLHWMFCKSYIKAAWKEFKLMLKVKW